jgi:hypothetical protein
MGMAMSSASKSASSGELIIYLHNAWYEMHKDGTPHPKFGVYDLDGIRSVLGENAELMTPERGAHVDPSAAAAMLVKTVRAELAAGRPASAIKVIGASKGGILAMHASAHLNEPDIRWVVIGSCSDVAFSPRAPRMTGRVLSIYEASDSIGKSCSRNATFSEATKMYEEIRTETGLDHGFLFRADPSWVKPALAW